jgi:tetratricopeptide (TPR) repeat protein
MSKRSKRRKRGRGGRRGPRATSAGAAAEYRRGIREADTVLADEGIEIGAGNWRELALDWLAPEEPDRGELARYIATYEPQLGVRWAREILRFQVFFVVEEYQQAIDHYDRALSRYAPCALVDLLVGGALLRYGGDLWRAREMLRSIPSQLLQRPDPPFELGFLHYLLGDFSGALDWYNQAAARLDDDTDPDVAAPVFYNRAVVRYSLDRDREAAISDLEEALHRRSEYPQAQRLLRELGGRRRWWPW